MTHSRNRKVEPDCTNSKHRPFTIGSLLQWLETFTLRTSRHTERRHRPVTEWGDGRSRNRPSSGAAAVVPIKDDGTVVMIRQFRHAVGGFIYEIPAGKLDPGEDPLNCAARELEEEVGYRASSFELLSSIFTAPGFADEVIHVYKASGLTKGRQQLDRDEVLEIVEMPLGSSDQKNSRRHDPRWKINRRVTSRLHTEHDVLLIRTGARLLIVHEVFPDYILYAR